MGKGEMKGEGEGKMRGEVRVGEGREGGQPPPANSCP